MNPFKTIRSEIRQEGRGLIKSRRYSLAELHTTLKHKLFLFKKPQAVEKKTPGQNPQALKIIYFCAMKKKYCTMYYILLDIIGLKTS